MNLAVITLIVEVFGVAAIITSLLYLAIQIRQSNRATQSATASEISARFVTWMEKFSSMENLKFIMTDEKKALEELTVPDLVEIFAAIQITFKMIEEMHYQYSKGYIDEELWIGWRAWFGNVKSYNINEVFFAAKRSNYSPAFAKFWNELPNSKGDNLVTLAVSCKKSDQ